MDISLSFFWRLELDNKIYIWDVESTWSHICSNQNLEFVFLKSLHGNLTLVLGNISMHYLNVLLNFVRQNQRICIGFSLSEDNSFSISSIADEDISECWKSVLEGTTNSQVLHSFGGLILQVLA